MSAVIVDKLSHRYRDRQALREVSFRVDSGAIFGLLGANGSGKSTAFRILSTQMEPTSGDVRIFGRPLAERKAIREAIGVVFQAPALDKLLTVEENLRVQGWLYRLSGNALRAAIDGALDRMGLRERRAERIATLSGGLQRRVEIAKVLLHGPRLLILDEPTTGLDPLIRRELLNLFARLRAEQGMTILFTTHYLEEADACDVVGILDGGALVALDSPARLKAEVGDELLTVRSPQPEELGRRIREQLDLKPVLVGRELRIEVRNGHRAISQLMERWPDEIDTITLGKPTLEDFFVKRTGGFYASSAREGRA